MLKENWITIQSARILLVIGHVCVSLYNGPEQIQASFTHTREPYKQKIGPGAGKVIPGLMIKKS